MLVFGDEVRDLAWLADYDRRSRVGDAVVEVGDGCAVRQRHEYRTEPLAAPVQLDALGLVRDHARDASATRYSANGQPRRDAGGTCAHFGVRQPPVVRHECFAFGCSLGRVEKAEREVHAPAISAMASTIAVYPVQRQSWPASMSTISSRVGGRSRASRSSAAMRIPGVQNPHWSA